VSRYVAFLRAINVGGHTVKMGRLRELFEALRFGGVTTFIASGNVVFDDPGTEAAALERQIEEQLRNALGYPVATFLRRAADVAAIADYQPFGAPDPAAADCTLMVGFLKEPPGAGARGKVIACRSPLDDFHLHERELYWLCRTRRTSDSAVSGAVLERALGGPCTLRNVTTVRRLAAQLAQDGTR
jgi:uncharacterized protein (DUF1697 family)